MTKAMLNTLKTACIITTVTGLTALSTRAADSTTTTTTTRGTSAYDSTAPASHSLLGEHSAKSFIKQAFKDNQTEIDMAQVGESKAQNADLKAFCQQLQTDHTKANQELQPIAQKYGVAEDATKLHEHDVNKLEKETAGAEFDKKFATEMLKDHQKAIKKFERAASKLQEADVRQYAQTMLPKLREHLDKAQTVARSVGVDQSTITSIMNKASAVCGTAEEENSTVGTGTSSTTDNTTIGTGTTGKTTQGAGAQQLQPDTTTTPSNTPKR
jgi:putative membrane protein